MQKTLLLVSLLAAPALFGENPGWAEYAKGKEFVNGELVSSEVVENPFTQDESYETCESQSKLSKFVTIVMPTEQGKAFMKLPFLAVGSVVTPIVTYVGVIATALGLVASGVNIALPNILEEEVPELYDRFSAKLLGITLAVWLTTKYVGIPLSVYLPKSFAKNLAIFREGQEKAAQDVEETLEDIAEAVETIL